MLIVISDLLDISKIEAGKLELVDKPFELSHVLDSVTNMFLNQARRKGINLHYGIHINTPDRLTGDSRRLKQILINLIGNALKFTHRGEIRVFVKSLSQDDNSVTLHFSVQDTGIGIPLEKQEEIFTEFSQVGTVLTREQEGTGLGLSISKRIVEMHGGEIGVESEVGKGSTFWFRIPREQGDTRQE